MLTLVKNLNKMKTLLDSEGLAVQVVRMMIILLNQIVSIFMLSKNMIKQMTICDKS